MKNIALRNGLFITGALTLAMGGAQAQAQAQAPAVPHALVASPDIYKVIAENDKYRVVEVTWQPGQRDKLHSHPDSAVYYTTDCTLRAYGASGVAIGSRLLGTAVVQAPIAAHTIENVGTGVCKLVMFEPK